ncbi:MAG: NADP-dependent 3-hydroxy acid dehydrogenase YdfG [Planctomycetota bacterium]|jgi:NADP-dependent 3-hydroxy acid dehydrogenase YdfG
MLASVLHHVTERFSDRIETANNASMKAIGEDLASATKDSIDRSCYANVQTLHAATKSFVTAYVDQEVNVIAHHGVRGQFEVKAIFSFAKAALENFDHMLLSKIRNAPTKLDRHMHAMRTGN